MAEFQLSRTQAEAGVLPPVCMQCGAPATEEVQKKYSSDKLDLIVPPEMDVGPIGCLLWPIWLLLGLIKLISWSSAKTMTVRTPLCRKHARGWFTWSTLEAKSITDDAIVIQGVSEEFVRVWRMQAVASPARPGEVIKIRCRECQALNDEAAKFCSQCGKAIS